MYRRTLVNHWNDLMKDFERTHEGVEISAIRAAKLQEWYRIRSHRFRSISSAEGKALHGLKQQGLAAALQEKISRFSFSEVEMPARESLKGRLVFHTVLIAVMFLLLPYIGLKSLLIRIVLGLAGFSIGFLWHLHQVLMARKLKKEQHLMEYKKQLEAYLPELLQICDRFEL